MVASARLPAVRRCVLAGFLVAALAAPGGARAAVSLVKVGDFASPVYVTAPPGDASRLLVVEQGGTVRLLRDGALSGRAFIDLTDRVLSGGERGLLSIAFAPDYATSGLVYAYFTNKDGDIEMDERDPWVDTEVAGSPATIVTVAHRSAGNHNGGQLQFGPD